MYKHKLISMAFAAALATIVVVFTALSAFGAPKPDLSFTTPPRTTAAGVSSETITVSLPSGLTGPAEVKLNDSSSTGVFRNAADTATITGLTIPSGQSQASFRFRDTTAGNPTLSATAMSTAAKKQWNGNLSGSQTETVVPAAIDHMTLAPSTATVSSGTGQAYTATGFDKYNNSLGTVTSQTTFTVAPNGSCEGATCRAALVGTHTVTGTDGAATAQATLNVTAGPLDHLTVTPSSSSIAAGASQTYKVEGYDAAGNDLGDYSSKAAISISPDGSCTGATCQAQVAGPHTVSAAVGSVKGTASLSVVAAALDHLQLSPASASVASGESQSYTAAGFDKYGNPLGDVTAKTTFSITPNGTCEGATCHAGVSGSHTVTGTDGSAEGKAVLQVEVGPLARIAISPQLSTIGSGGTQAYSVEGFDAFGNDLGDLTSKTSFGITPDGSCEGAVCTASHHGSHTVKATYGSFTDQAALEVESEPATTVSLTFDDSRADQMQAAQILAEHKMVATFFVISGRVGASGYMSLPNLEELATAGNEIADHTVNHLNLTNVNREEAERQVCNARIQLEAWGFHVTDFAYPQGGADPELEEIVQNCGLDSARIVGDIVSP
ncbi:MAG: polysaccharide deacetylase family protein, partial [Solirubrobacterales bacterium]